MKLVVQFETNDLKEKDFFSDELTIISDGGFKKVIPLYAYKPSSVIVFEPFINLGFVQANSQKIYKMEFKNEGVVEDKINLRLEGLQDIQIEPQYFVLRAGAKQEVEMIYSPKEAGIFRGTIEVDCLGQSVVKTIDISATSVEYFIFLIDENGIQTQSVDFGSMYFG